MSTAKTPTNFLKLSAVMSRYGYTRAGIYGLIKQRVLPPPVKIGARAVRFRAEDLVAFEATLSPTKEPRA